MANDDPHAQMIKAPDGFDPRKVRCRNGAEACASLRATSGVRARRGVRRAAARAARPAAAGRTRRPSARRRSGDRSCRRGAGQGRPRRPPRARAHGRRGRAGGRPRSLTQSGCPIRVAKTEYGNARRRHLDERRADAEAVADLHSPGPARQGQVLAERPRLGASSRFSAPPGVVLAAVEVERLVEPAVGLVDDGVAAEPERTGEAAARPAPCGSRSRSCAPIVIGWRGRR